MERQILEIEGHPDNGEDHLEIEVLLGRINISLDNRNASCSIIVSPQQAQAIIAFLKTIVAE